VCLSVDYDDDEAPRDAHGQRAKVAFEGWMTEIQFAAHIGVVIPATTKCAASVAIKFDDGDSMVAELRGRSGWIRDQDGDAHRMRRLGDEQLIHDEAKWKCETCEAEFDNERCLRGHTSSQ